MNHDANDFFLRVHSLGCVKFGCNKFPADLRNRESEFSSLNILFLNGLGFSTLVLLCFHLFHWGVEWVKDQTGTFSSVWAAVTTVCFRSGVVSL